MKEINGMDLNCAYQKYIIGKNMPLDSNNGNFEKDLYLKILKRNINQNKPIEPEVLKNLNKKEILEKIGNYDLSEKIIYYANEYDEIFGNRNKFLWKFMGAIFEEKGIVLSTVDEKYFKSVTDSKIILTILVCILDDVADLNQDKTLLNEMIEIMKIDSDKNPSNKKLKLVKELWNDLISELKKYPRYEEFIDIFMFDLKQTINALDYSYLINKNPEIINLSEVKNYDSHNMIVFLMNGIDLMASTSIDKRDLPPLRKAFWHAQQMARVGNWLSTWRREVKEKDFSSGVFAYIFSNNIIKCEEIEKLSDEEIIRKIEQSDINSYFFDLWEKNFKQLKSLKSEIKSVDMNRYCTGFENVLKYHMSTVGYK